MENLTFVGRHSELRKLLSLLWQGSNGQGHVVFIEGDAGMGKTLLMQALQEKVFSVPEMEGTRFVYGYCYEETGPQNAYQPFLETLEDLSNADNRQKGIFQLFTTIIKETSPDWLQAIPVIGATLGAGVKTATIAGEWFFDSDKAVRSENMSEQYISTVTEIAKHNTLLVLMIEDAHWIDHASCQLLVRLARQLGNNKIVVIISYRPREMTAEHPLQKAKNQLLTQGDAHIISLAGLSKKEIDNYIILRFGKKLHEHLSSWLIHLCNGHPLFVTQYINLLEQTNIIKLQDDNYILDGQIAFIKGEWKLSGALANIPVPSGIKALLEQRIQRLLREECEMLQLGAVQGDKFMSDVLAELIDKQELSILARLRQVSERHHVINLYTDDEWYRHRTQIYAFEHVLMHQAFYEKLAPRERLLYHRGIAKILENKLTNTSHPQRKLILDIANHYKSGHEPLAAAQFYYLAAKSSFSDGAFFEATELCNQALKNIRIRPEDQAQRDQLQADVILLMLICTSYGDGDRATKLELLTLAKEGERAAERVANNAILSQIKVFKGHLMIHIGKTHEALAIMKRAVQIAHSSNDKVNECLVLLQLGTQLAKEDLKQSVEMRYLAYELYKENIHEFMQRYNESVLKRYFDRLLIYIGVGEFDQGNYTKAIEQLTKGTDGLRQLKMYNDLLDGLNYLGQAYIETGLFEKGVAAIKEAIDLRKDEEEDHPWNGYNLALLGKLYLEWERIEDAAEPLIKGLHKSEIAQQANLITIVRNYYAELLMHPDYEKRDLALAEHYLIKNIGESQTFGLYRSAVTGLSLRSQLKLMQDMVEDAINDSNQAIEYLKRYGDMPAVRTEEVLFNHYRALSAANRESEAQTYLNYANNVLQKKAKTIKNEEDRRIYLERVPLSREIQSHHARIFREDVSD